MMHYLPICLVVLVAACGDVPLRDAAEARRDSLRTARIESAIARDSAAYGADLARTVAVLLELYNEPVVAGYDQEGRSISVYADRWQALYPREREYIEVLADDVFGDGPVAILDHKSGHVIDEL